MSNAAIKFLRDREWTAGNGQCHECLGVSDKWYGDIRYTNASSIGHHADCKIALALHNLGEIPIMRGAYIPPDGSTHRQSENTKNMLNNMKDLGLIPPEPHWWKDVFKE